MHVVDSLTSIYKVKRSATLQPYFFIENRVENIAEILLPKGSNISAIFLFIFCPLRNY